MSDSKPAREKVEAGCHEEPAQFLVERHKHHTNASSPNGSVISTVSKGKVAEENKPPTDVCCKYRPLSLCV